MKNVEGSWVQVTFEDATEKTQALLRSYSQPYAVLSVRSTEPEASRSESSRSESDAAAATSSVTTAAETHALPQLQNPSAHVDPDNDILASVDLEFEWDAVESQCSLDEVDGLPCDDIFGRDFSLYDSFK